MRMAINKIKWFAVSVSVLSLLMVVWVWPAWNSGSQNWYLGNNGYSLPPLQGRLNPNTMYRSYHPPPPYNVDFVVPGPFNSYIQYFRANEAAMTMLNFGTAGWDYHIEWYHLTPEIAEAPPVPAAPAIVRTIDLQWHLDIGRWRNGMFEPFHTVMGSYLGQGGSMVAPVVISGSTMSSMTPLLFDRDDVLGARFNFASMSSGEFHIPVNNTCFITSPLSDPGYPGSAAPAQVPTLSQWGMLLFAVIIAGLSVFVIRRRVRMGRH